MDPKIQIKYNDDIVKHIKSFFIEPRFEVFLHKYFTKLTSILVNELNYVFVNNILYFDIVHPIKNFDMYDKVLQIIKNLEDSEIIDNYFKNVFGKNFIEQQFFYNDDLYILYDNMKSFIDEIEKFIHITRYREYHSSQDVYISYKINNIDNNIKSYKRINDNGICIRAIVKHEKN